MSANDGMVLVNVVQFTLRDWFAGMAMHGINANPSVEMRISDLAEFCCEHGIGLLVAREKK